MALYGRLFDVVSAFSHYRQANALHLTLGKLQGQAAVQMNPGILYVLLGKYREGVAAFRQASHLFAKLQDPRGQLLSSLILNATAPFQEEYSVAKEPAQENLN